MAWSGVGAGVQPSDEVTDFPGEEVVPGASNNASVDAARDNAAIGVGEFRQICGVDAMPGLIPKWRATTDDDEHYVYAVAL